MRSIAFNRHFQITCSLLFAALLFPVPSFADEWGFLELRSSGGKIYGKLLEAEFKDPVSGRSCIVIETPSGGKIQMERTQASWHPADGLQDQYDERMKLLDDTAEDHADMVNWCREQKSGKSRFRNQIEFHLLQVLKHDPTNKEAKKDLTAMGWILLEDENRWVPEVQFYANNGYVRAGSRWITQTQKVINDALEQQEKILGERKKLISNWERQIEQLQGPGAEQQAISELRAITDEYSIPIIDERASKEENEAKRLIMMEAIGQVPCVAAQNALVRFLLTDKSLVIHERALELLLQPDFDKGQCNRFRAATLIIGSGALRPEVCKDNIRLQLNAEALGELQTLNSVLPLIEAIETTHMIATGNDPNRMSFGQGSGGSGLKTGGGPAEIKKTFRNEKVLAALRKITNANPGPTPALWRNWYLDNFTLSNSVVSRDD